MRGGTRDICDGCGSGRVYTHQKSCEAVVEENSPPTRWCTVLEAARKIQGGYEFGVRVGHGPQCQLHGGRWRVGNDIGSTGLVEEGFGPENGCSQWQNTGLAISRTRRREGGRTDL